MKVNGHPAYQPKLTIPGNCNNCSAEAPDLFFPQQILRIANLMSLKESITSKRIGCLKEDKKDYVMREALYLCLAVAIE